MSYQDLQAYHGSIYGPTRYNGIEYNNELADSLVLGSPGGVDSISGHYSGGFYSYKSSSANVYAGQDERYIAGEFGDLYSPTHWATINGGPSGYLSSSSVPHDSFDDIYTANSSFPPSMQLDSAQSSVKGFSRIAALGHPPPPYSYPSLEQNRFDESDEFQQVAPISTKKQSKKKSTRETFVGGEHKSTIPQTSVENFASDTRKIRVNPTFLFVSFLLVYFCIALWSSTLYEFLKSKFFNGKDIPWTWLAILATVLTAVFFGTTYLFDIPLLEFDRE